MVLFVREDLLSKGYFLRSLSTDAVSSPYRILPSTGRGDISGYAAADGVILETNQRFGCGTILIRNSRQYRGAVGGHAPSISGVVDEIRGSTGPAKTYFFEDSPGATYDRH